MGPCICNHHYYQPSGSSPCLSQAKKNNQSSRLCCNGIRHDSVCPYGFEANFQLIWSNEMDVARSDFMALPLFKGSLNIPPFPTCIFTTWKILEGVPICGSLPRTYKGKHTQLCGYFGLLLAGVPLFSGSKVHHPFAESAPESLPPNSTPPARRMFFFNPTILR